MVHPARVREPREMLLVLQTFWPFVEAVSIVVPPASALVSWSISSSPASNFAAVLP